MSQLVAACGILCDRRVAGSNPGSGAFYVCFCFFYAVPFYSLYFSEYSGLL